jgi:hypothetical protein
VRHHRRQPSGHGHRLLRPTIRGAHAPGERVEVASVDKAWQLLRAILTDIATG